MDAIKLKTPVLDRLTAAEFYDFCLDHRELRIKRDAQHQITIIPPASSETGAFNSEFTYQLAHWNRQHQLGLTFDSSAGFTLPSGAMLSPDASWLSQARWEALAAAEQRGFAHICPDFVAEFLSPSDRLTDLMRKMETWLEAGAKLAWLIVPASESVFVFELDSADAARRGLRPAAEWRAGAAGLCAGAAPAAAQVGRLPKSAVQVEGPYYFVSRRAHRWPSVERPGSRRLNSISTDKTQTRLNGKRVLVISREPGWQLWAWSRGVAGAVFRPGQSARSRIC